MIKKYIQILIISTLIFFALSKASLVKAAVTFSDSFSGGFNSSMWIQIPGTYDVPITTGFGIGDSIPPGPNYLRGIEHDEPMPADKVIEWDTKVNSIPSQMFFGWYQNNDGFRIDFNQDGSIKLHWFPTGAEWLASKAWSMSQGIHHFQIRGVGTTITLVQDDNQLYSSDIGVRMDGNRALVMFQLGDSEFANYKICDSNGCATPIPTPTPPPVTKVVVVPGFGGSWNRDALMNCRDNTDPWTSWSASDLVYGSLLSSIHNSGFTEEPFYYDWRKTIPNIKLLLTEFINDGLAPLEKVNIVGHSMGGLVAREYIEQEGSANKAEKFYSVGAPHKGTILAYPAWSAGEIWGSLPFRIAATTVIKNCKNKHPELSDREIVRQFIPSVRNLLPVFDYLKEYKTNTPRSVTDAINGWLQPDNPPFFIGTTYGSLSGSGYSTLQWLDVVNPGPRDGNNWADGKPKKKEYTIMGDGVVLNTSSVLNGGVGDKLIPQDHGGLVSSIEGIDAILRFLTLGTNIQPIPSTAVYAPWQTAIVVMSDSGDFSVIRNGKSIKDKEGVVVIPNPNSGIYSLHFLPKSDKTRIIVAQFLEEKTLWREYQLKDKSPKDSVIQFDPSNTTEDILK